MALSGLQIYKLLPQTNCKECNFLHGLRHEAGSQTGGCRRRAPT